MHPTDPKDSPASQAADAASAPARQPYRWTPARIVIGCVLVLGMVIPMGYLVMRELGYHASAVLPFASAQSRPGEGAQGASPLNQFDTSDLRVDQSKILSGGPPKDGIPAITDPSLISAEDADYLSDESRVVSVTVEDKTRAYPLNILNWHEIINDELGGVPIAVVYCPLCDSVSVVDRRLAGKTLEFGVSGLLMNSNVLLYDRTDESLWSQVGLTAISGPHAGESLRHLDSWAIVAFDPWKRKHPDGRVVSADTGHRRDYRRNPYGQYFANDQTMFPVSPTDDRYPNKMRVIGVQHGDAVRAYPLQAVREATEGRLSDTINGEPLVLQTQPGTGNVSVVEAPKDAAVVHTFWFAWYAFHPNTQVFDAQAVAQGS